MTAAWRGLLISVVLAGLVSGCTSGPDPQSSGETATGLSHEEQMQDMADDYGITAPPEVAVVREITPAESVTVLADCMSDAGWPVDVVDGVAEFEYPPGAGGGVQPQPLHLPGAVPDRRALHTPVDRRAGDARL